MRVLLTTALCLAVACGHAPPETEAPPEGDPVQGVPAEDLFAQGVALARRGDLVRAEQYLVASMQRGLDEERVMPVLLRVLVAASRLRVALDHAEPYLARHPEDWALRYLVGSIHLGMGDRAGARRELERAVELAPEQPEPHYLLAVVLRDELAEPAAAQAHFERYLELAPEGDHAGEAREALRTRELPAPVPGGTAPAAPAPGEASAEPAPEEGT